MSEKLPCLAGDTRSQLKHTFIENTLLALREDLLRLHLRENQQFVRNMATLARELVARLIDDYNPVALLERIEVLEALPEGLVVELRHRLDEKYRRLFMPHERVERLTTTWQDLEDSLRAWEQESDAPGEQTFSDVLSKVRAYRDELVLLPRGVWTG